MAEVFANGQERTVRVAADVRIQDESGKELRYGLEAPELKEGATATLNVKRDGNAMAIVAIRRGGKVNGLERKNGASPTSVGKNSVGFKPLNEMSATDEYQGEDGGLYGTGQNEPPESLNAAAEVHTAMIRPLDAEGNPATDGRIGVVWIRLANAGPGGELREHGKQLERDTRTVLANLTHHYPNLQIAYLGSRIYGGYADGRLNPEPYAYEGAFVVRWLIQSQLAADADLNNILNGVQ